MDEIKIGVVGAGGIVRDRHVPGFEQVDGVRLDAVVNRSRTSSKRAAAEFGIPRIHDRWQKLVADPQLDAVLVGTWPYLHAPVTIAALEAGKHVLVQARIAMNADEARAIHAAADSRPDLTVMVVPAPFTLWADACIKRLLGEGVIGPLRLVHVFWGGGAAYTPGPDWRRLRKHSGNNMEALGIVYESVVRWTGYATWVQAATQVVDTTLRNSADGQADVPDVISLIAGLPGGAHLTLDMSPHARFMGPSRVEMFGDEGTLTLEFGDERLTASTEGSIDPIVPRDDERADWRVEEEFVGAIRGTEEVQLTDVATAVKYMEFTDAVHESATTGQRVTLP